jgi:Secretion system C-terminal sorting domain/Lipocalin-like domain/CrtC N-terminal lipocalin domain
LDVTVTSNRTPLVVGGDGFVPIGGKGDSSFYYSYSNMKVTGKLKYGGITDSITSGIAWIDRQYGPFTVGINSSNKYEWYSLQLDKPGTVLGTPQTPSEYNVWQIYSDSTTIPYTPEWRLVSEIFPDNSQDTTSAYLFERKGYWKDPAGGKYYSNGWRIIDPKHGVNIDMTPNISNQLIDVTAFKFWEGGTKLKGTVNNLPVEGVGFAELVAAYNKQIIVPSVPAGLTVVPYPDHVSLSWTASTAGTYPIGGYRIYRSTTNDGHWQYIASTTNLTYTDNSVSGTADYFYTVSSFDNQSATTASDYATALPTGITAFDQKNDLFKVFPNPTAGVFDLQFTAQNGNEKIESVEIFNLLGEKTFAINNIKQLGNYKIDITDAPNGVYFVKVYTANKCFSEKIMKQ